jgi:hypothetical protein
MIRICENTRSRLEEIKVSHEFYIFDWKTHTQTQTQTQIRIFKHIRLYRQQTCKRR